MGAVVTQVPLDSTLALVSRARRGDRAAHEQLADRYQAALLRFAHGRMPSAARGLVDTIDIVQTVMMRALARLDSIDTSLPGGMLAYLRRAVLNMIRDEIRRARRRPQVAALDERLPALDRDPLEAMISAEELARYNLAILQLPADQQEAFLMRIEMDCSYREIADALGRPTENAARMLVKRAIRAVTASLRDKPPA